MDDLVEVKFFCEFEIYKMFYYLVFEVIGILKYGVDCIDVFEVCFFGGFIIGVFKVCVM